MSSSVDKQLLISDTELNTELNKQTSHSNIDSQNASSLLLDLFTFMGQFNQHIIDAF